MLKKLWQKKELALLIAFFLLYLGGAKGKLGAVFTMLLFEFCSSLATLSFNLVAFWL